MVLEFKYTESFGVEAIRQTQAYDWFYRTSEGLTEAELQTFLICSKTPKTDRLKALGYRPSEQPGVFRHRYHRLNNVVLISLNELSDGTHNLAFKLFASKRKVRTQTLDTIIARTQLTEEVVYFFRALREQGDTMRITEDEIQEMERMLAPVFVARASYEERLRGVPASEIVKAVPASELLKAIPTNEILKAMLESDQLDEQTLSGIRNLLLIHSHENEAG